MPHTPDNLNDRHPSTGSVAGTTAAARAVVLVGAGERARAWLVPLRRSARLRVIATVARGEAAVAADLPRYGSLDEAMRAHPAAAFAIALPPRAALEGALQLAAAGRAGVVEAPLHDRILDANVGPNAAGVRVAHGWVTLPGLHAIEAVMRRAGAGRVHVEVAGLPEEEGGDLGEVLVHAAALVRALLPQATAAAARYADGDALEVELAAPSPAGEWTVQLRLLTHGQRIAVRVEAAGEMALWSWKHDRESVMLGGVPLIAPHATPPAAVRALAQLLPDAARGDGLVEAAAALRLARSCLVLLPTRVPLGARSLRQSASIARRRPSDLLGRLGLRGEVRLEAVDVLQAGPSTSSGRAEIHNAFKANTAQAEPFDRAQGRRVEAGFASPSTISSASGLVPTVLTLATPPEPFELWAFRAGVKPVVFLTVRPDEVERTLALFGDAHCERRDRRVQVEAQDRWTDRRDAGEPRVELYIARDLDLARRAAYLQAEVDPTRALREIGALVGYPPCCVDAFARQDDRANNSRNRYHSQARTLAPDGSTAAPWPWELNNLHTMIVPFYPCSYRCAPALAWARAALAEMARAHPAFVEALRVSLARPVLYFDHDHQLAFDGAYVDGRITYRAVALAPTVSPPLAALAAAIGRGDRLLLDDRQLLVERTGQVVLRLERIDPALGFVAPFGLT